MAKKYAPRNCASCDTVFTAPYGNVHCCVPCREARRKQQNKENEQKRIRNWTADGIRRRASHSFNKEERNSKRRLRYASDPIGNLIQGAKDRAKELDVAFDLDQHVEHYRKLIKAGVCELTGLPFVAGAGRRSPFSPSLDRIRPEGGYVRGNVRVIVWALNAGIGNWGLSDFATVAKALLRKNPWL